MDLREGSKTEARMSRLCGMSHVDIVWAGGGSRSVSKSNRILHN